MTEDQLKLKREWESHLVRRFTAALALDHVVPFRVVLPTDKDKK